LNLPISLIFVATIIKLVTLFYEPKNVPEFLSMCLTELKDGFPHN
jgi:hypothetical protein